MSETLLTCISIDDDALFQRKLEAFIEDIDWLNLIDCHNNPVQGATAVIKQSPDLLLLDMEMPYIDGDYLMDWIEPKLSIMEKRPKVIVLSSKNILEEEKKDSAAGYIKKHEMISPEELERRLKEILN